MRIFPVPMRVEHAEREKLNSARKLIASRFTRFLGRLSSDEISKYWGSVEILSDPFYAYEEILCAFGDAPGQPSSMSASIERIARYLTNGRVENHSYINDQTRTRVLSAFSQVLPDVPPGTRCFISYAHADNESPNRKERWLDRFVEFLQPLISQENFTLSSDQDIEIGDSGTSTSKRTLPLLKQPCCSLALHS